MTKLTEMWEALAAYQPHADAAGHGESWARMCTEKTIDDAYVAATAAYAADAAAAAAAATAAYAAADAVAAGIAEVAAYAAAEAVAADAVYWAQKAIDLIKKITTTPASPVQELYNELLFAVARKHPNETRHQTALRYIQQAESGGANQCADAHGIKKG